VTAFILQLIVAALIFTGSGSAERLRELPSLPDTLRTLPAGPDTLKALPTVPDTLRTLPAGPDTLRTLPTVPDTLRSDTLQANGVLSDTLGLNATLQLPDTVAVGVTEPSNEVEKRYRPLQFTGRPGFETTLNDSLLRWMQLLNLPEWMNRRSGVIPHRLGGLGRNDAAIIDGHNPVNQQVYFEGIPVADPVTGLVNMNRIQLFHLENYEEQTGHIYAESHYRLRRYYLLRPLTFIHYEQGPDGLLSTGGLVSMNATGRTNLEMSLWNLNDPGVYPRSGYDGLQSVVAVHHQYSSRLAFRAGLYYNSHQMSESGGYQMPSMQTWHFDRFLAVPVLQGARSSVRQTLLRADTYYRAGGEEPVTIEGGVWHQRFRRFMFSGADTTFYRVLQSGGRAGLSGSAGPHRYRADTRIVYTAADPDRDRSMAFADRTEAAARGDVVFFEGSPVELQTRGGLTYRSDGFVTWSGGVFARIQPIERLKLTGGASAGTIMPTLQQLNWRDSRYRSDPGLETTEILRLQGGISWQLTGALETGISGYVQRLNRDVLTAGDSSFVNAEPYYVLGGDAYARYLSTNWEIEAASTLLLYRAEGNGGQVRFLETSGTRSRNRVSVYRKGYLFDYATYLKGGMHVVLSPNPYRAAGYLAAPDWWDIAAAAEPVPAFYQVDLDVSARIRSMVFMMRYENLFDQVGQFGYFETPYYPMPGRRFRIAIRWVLRN
jgi:hypothetical protein